MSKPTGRIIAIAALGAAAAGASALWIHGEGGRDAFLAASRFTARWSSLWFLAAWTASSLAKLWPGGWRTWALFNRRGIGLGFAAAHFIHAGFFLTAILALGAPSTLATILGGGLGYVFVALMALTSNDWSMRRLGPKNWRLLHTIGGGYIAFVIAFTYYGMLERRPEIAAIGLAFVGAAIALRVAAWLKARQPRAA
jgi:methionine sulfoxide reductase heme-binding subunit